MENKLNGSANPKTAAEFRELITRNEKPGEGGVLTRANVSTRSLTRAASRSWARLWSAAATPIPRPRRIPKASSRVTAPLTDVSCTRVHRLSGGQQAR